MGLMENIRQWLWQFLRPEEYMNTERRERLTALQENLAYYQGQQRRFIKQKTNGPDHNIIVNFTGAIVERSVSMLVGGGVGFDLPGDGDTPEQAYIDSVYEANKSQIMLHKAAQYASIYGTGYLRIVPGGIVKNEVVLPRLLPVDPRWMSIHTDPEDMDVVVAYENRFNITVGDEQIARREMIEREARGMEEAPDYVWMIRNYRATKASQCKWELMDEVEWPYPFPPLIHWQNLPEPGNVYGQSDIADVMELQDKFNLVASNTMKILWNHAHPKTWGRNANMGSTASWGADEMVLFTGDNAMLQNLEMQSDLASSTKYMEILRQALFDIARTVDITSLGDKIGMGNLTNFGIRVLFLDALAKLETKKALFGEALKELNTRLLVLADFAEIEPGDIVWPDNLPKSDLENLQAARLELGAGLVSKQTIATERGRDWEAEQERLLEEAAQGDNIGAMLLRGFNAGQV